MKSVQQKHWLAVVLIPSIGLAAAFAGEKEKLVQLYADIGRYVEKRVSEFDQIPVERKAKLAELTRFIETTAEAGKPVRLTFICTHNSRRSQLAELWAQVAAAHYRIRDFQAYSGGTESSAFNPRAVEAARRAGFRIEQTTNDENPIYHVRYSDGALPITCFSKVYNQAPNPKSSFCAIMVCSDADRACPAVTGAAARIAIPYDDPKNADGTAQERAVYDERCAQIARELLYAFSRVKSPAPAAKTPSGTHAAPE